MNSKKLAAAVTARRRLALLLRSKGKTYSEIGKELGRMPVTWEPSEWKGRPLTRERARQIVKTAERLGLTHD